MAQLATFAALFIVSVFLINPPVPEKPGVEQKAEFLITLSWPAGNLDDIDLHLLMPDGRMVNFITHQQGYAMLDADDTGINDSYTDHDGITHLVRGHQEVITVRAIVPGTYVVNVHVYRVTEDLYGVTSTPRLPYPVHVTLTKINPRVDVIGSADVVLSHIGEQKTAFAFTVTDSGWAVIDTTVDRPFIPVRTER